MLPKNDYGLSRKSSLSELSVTDGKSRRNCGLTISDFLKNPVYDTQGDMYMSKKHKWKIYLQKRVKQREDNSEDPNELLETVDNYIRKSQLYSYNRKPKRVSYQAMHFAGVKNASHNPNHLTRCVFKPPPVFH